MPCAGTQGWSRPQSVTGNSGTARSPVPHSRPHAPQGTFDVAMDLALRVQVLQALQDLPQRMVATCRPLQGARLQLQAGPALSLSTEPAQPSPPPQAQH